MKIVRSRRKIKTLIGILKDKSSLIKATLIPDRTTSSIQTSVLRATSRSSMPPPDHRIATILYLGNASRSTAASCIVSIMNRLHRTKSVYVALKSLFTLHNIITKGSFILKDQLSFYPSAGGWNSLNLSKFIDKTNSETWEFSTWVRWYAAVIECNLIASRVLGIYFSSSLSRVDKDLIKKNLTNLLNSELLREIDALVSMVEEICTAPESLDQRIELVYEILKLVVEDYRMTQHHLSYRLTEFEKRVNELSAADLDELVSCLIRLENCKGRLKGLFQNRKRNDEFWDLIKEMKVKVEKLKDRREMKMLEYRSESTQMRKLSGPSQILRLLPYGGNWSTIDRLQLTVSTVSA